jgi:hypothetical protein
MVQARLFQINRGLLGQQSFLPVNFDREYTCLTMTTVHSALIDYRFRQVFQRRIKNKESNDFENIQPAYNLDEVLRLEAETFQMNGILVESKNETDDEKKKFRQRVLNSHPLL